MQAISKTNLPEPSAAAHLEVPEQHLFNLPEKVLQFGTGVLLRGLPDYLIDQANRRGIFNGRVVVVKSTSGGELEAFDRQDSLYTLCVRGLEDGVLVEKNIVSSAISRVLAAKDRWAEILEFAASPDLEVVISNTTEVGLTLVRESIHQSPPDSFPAKLLAVLYARWRAFGGDPSRGLVIIPTELIPDNGKKLAGILLELAQHNELEAEFITWLQTANRCCSSLVDRIVPGHPADDARQALEAELGYNDDLLTMAEVYLLWAIEGDEDVRRVLSFHQVHPNVIIEPDIDVHRELKLRLLNGTHTLSCGLAFLAGIPTVSEATKNAAMSTFIRRLMLDDIAPAIPYPIDGDRAAQFGRQVLDRFGNPFIEHRWINITLQYTSKMRMRNLPVLLEHYRKRQDAPRFMALGFAAYLRFVKAEREQDGAYFGVRNGEAYPIKDDAAAYFYEVWQTTSLRDLPRRVLSDRNIWGADLTQLPGFADAVTDFLIAIVENGAAATLRRFVAAEEHAQA